MEDNKEVGSILFFDTTVKPKADGSLSITVYRKCTHTDQYLQWDSHHHLSAKFSVICTLSHRPKQCAVSLSCSNKKRTTSGRLSLNANILSGLWTRWRRFNKSTSEVIDGVHNQGTTVAQAVTREVKTKGPHCHTIHTRSL